jgi:hypothetical protein
MAKLEIKQKDLLKYVDAANMMAATLEMDIKKGRTISSDTVVALSKFIAAAMHIKSLSDALEEGRTYEN